MGENHRALRTTRNHRGVTRRSITTRVTSQWLTAEASWCTEKKTVLRRVPREKRRSSTIISFGTYINKPANFASQTRCRLPQLHKLHRYLCPWQCHTHSTACVKACHARNLMHLPGQVNSCLVIFHNGLHSSTLVVNNLAALLQALTQF